MPSDSTDRTLRKHRSSPDVDDSEETHKRRKHRSSPDFDDSEETHKRRKHHHHHHHRKHRHRSHHHRSKKDVTKEATEVEMDEKELLKEEHNGDHSGRDDVVVEGVVGAVVNGASLGIGSDMEEGEIIEEDEGVIVGNSGVNFNTSSKGGDVSCKVEKEGRESQKHGKSRPLVVEMDNSKDRTTSERIKNNDSNKERWSKHESPTDEYDQRIDNNVGGDVKNLSSSLSSESGEKKHRGLPSSPSQDRHGDGFTRNFEKSPELSRGRSRPRSVDRDVLQLDSPTELDHGHYLNSKQRIDSDDEQATDTVRKYQHRSKDHPRDKRRDQSPSYSRHMSRSDRHHSRDSRGRVREGSRDVHRDRSLDRKIEGEKAPERERRDDRDMDRGRDRIRDGDRDRERERRWDREREDRVRRERDNDSSRYRNKDRDRDIEVHREHNYHKYEVSDAGYVGRDNYDDSSNRRHRVPDGKERAIESYTAKTDASRKSLKAGDKFRSDEDEEAEYRNKIELQLANQEEDDIEKIKEESRRRREAILMKYSNLKFQQKPDNKLEDGEDASGKLVEQPSEIGSAANGVHESSGARHEGSDDYVAEPLFSVGKSPQPNRPAVQKPSDTVGLGAGTPKSERSDDMFCDDIFGESPAGVRKTGKGDGLAIEKTGLHDNWDDAEGYYSYRFGEILDNRYEIIAAHGKGVFSTVIRAKDLKARPGDPEEVAIKIIRSNDTMYKAGMDEMVILKKLVGADPENKRHCVRFLSNFKYRNHLCLVFESLHMNLREVLKKFGRNIGLRLTAVRAYAKQLFIALKHLKNCGVLHCDIKPDNMLVNEPKNVLKLCDFGNAMFAGKNEITPYLVSRFYRAPEIILGLPYDHPMDIWSVGCCLFELFMGKVLFPGSSNNEMLRLHMELKGPFPKKLLRKGAFTVHHFDQDLNFLATEEDPVTKKAIKRLMLNVKPKDVGNLIVSSGEDPKMLANFKDLLEKIFVLDPEKRITVSQALSHPFITGK